MAEKVRKPNLMVLIKMITFCKGLNCPASKTLLRFQTKETNKIEAEAIEAHLNMCEFCDAEVQFYENHPQAEEPCETASIPFALFELAESLLGNRRNEISSLNRLISENESVAV